LAKEIASTHNRVLVVIFTADWCRYCNVLKADEDKLFHPKSHVVCYLDFDIEENKNLAKRIEVSILPTSIILQADKKGWTETSRKSGYKYEEYRQWIKEHTL